MPTLEITDSLMKKLDALSAQTSFPAALIATNILDQHFGKTSTFDEAFDAAKPSVNSEQTKPQTRVKKTKTRAAVSAKRAMSSKKKDARRRAEKAPTPCENRAAKKNNTAAPKPVLGAWIDPAQSVRVQYLDTKEIKEFYLQEDRREKAPAASGKSLPVDTPLGAMLLEHRVGEVFKFKACGRIREVKILECWTPEVNTTRLKKQKRSLKHLPRTQEMFEAGLLKTGMVLSLKNRPHGDAEIWDGRHVLYDGEVMTLNAWGCLVLNRSNVNIYLHAYLEDGRTLDDLRADLPKR